MSDPDRTACAAFARQRTEQLRREATKAQASHPTTEGSQLTANDIGWILFGLAALPVLVPALVASLPFGSWKAFADSNPDTWQLVHERLVRLCTQPVVLATTVGPRHPDTALALVALADEHLRADGIESALDRYRQALTIQEEALGPEHPLVTVTLEGYARALSRAGRTAEAAAMADRARRRTDESARMPPAAWRRRNRTMRRWRILFLIAWVILSGCVAVRQAPLPESESSRFAGKGLQRSAYSKPDFAAYTAGKAAFSVIGAALIIKAGNEIIRENAVEDPAIRIGRELSQMLAERHGLQLLASDPTVSQSDDVGALLQTYGDADLILDIKTINWMFIYFPTDWDNYRVLYSARLRVIDRQRKAVIAEGFCAYQPEYEDTNKAPTREDLVGNNAEGLKRELAKAADHCITFFRSNTFRM